jgi:signal transduction histidine kinase/CHASE3 domain sensor protein
MPLVRAGSRRYSWCRVQPTSIRTSLTIRLLAASAVLAVILAAAFAVLVSAVDDLRGSGRVAKRSQEATAAVSALQTLVSDVQVGMSGYLLTGDEGYLAPWRQARPAIEHEQRRVLRLITNAGQAARAREINRDISAWLAEVADPLVRTARRDPARARAHFRNGESNRRVLEIREQFARFERAQRELTVAHDTRADAQADRSHVLGLGGFGASAVLILLFCAYVARAVIRPVRRVADAADRIRAGHLETRVREQGSGEIARLSEAFNAMVESLQSGRRRLEQALGHLRSEKEHLEALYRFGERIGLQRGLPELAQAILDELRSFAWAEAGALYVVDEARQNGLHRLATCGVDPSRVPDEVDAGSPVDLPPDLDPRHALRMTLRVLGRDIGVLWLARPGRPFEPRELDAIQHLTDHAAVSLANALSFRAARREATINRAVLDATLDGIRLVDLEGRTLVANAAIDRLTTEVFGLPGDSTLYERAAIAGRLVNPEAFRATMAKIAVDPECETRDEFELADSRRSFQRYTGPVREADGRLLGRIIVVREVTSERQAERLKDDFVATVSHELRTPLTSVRGYLELVLDGEAGALNEDQERFLRVAQRNADQLLRLVGDLLFVARLEVGQLALERGEVDLAAVAFEAVEAARPLADARGATLHLSVEPMPRMWGDHARLAQLLDNLVSNAVKFSGEGGRIDVKTERSNGHAVIRVSDNGIGIAPADLDRLFERFFRAQGAVSQAIPGTGLGLTIAQAIVEGHGGRISVDSELGVGTTFCVELPLERTAAE